MALACLLLALGLCIWAQTISPAPSAVRAPGRGVPNASRAAGAPAGGRTRIRKTPTPDGRIRLLTAST
jgi:hypothetical protein